jgi:hypothetical protein
LAKAIFYQQNENFILDSTRIFIEVFRLLLFHGSFIFPDCILILGESNIVGKFSAWRENRPLINLEAIMLFPESLILLVILSLFAREFTQGSNRTVSIFRPSFRFFLKPSSCLSKAVLLDG